MIITSVMFTSEKDGNKGKLPAYVEGRAWPVPEWPGITPSREGRKDILGLGWKRHQHPGIMKATEKTAVPGFLWDHYPARDFAFGKATANQTLPLKRSNYNVTIPRGSSL